MPNPNARYAFDWLTKAGYKPHQAAGIVGNLVQESGVSPGNGTKGGDGGMSHGIAQWNRERLSRLHSFAAQRGGTPWNLDTQLGYLDYELKNYEKPAYNALMASRDVREATRAGISFERPRGWTTANPEGGHGWANRYANAQRIIGEPVRAGDQPVMQMPAGTNGTYTGPAAPGGSPVPSMVGAPMPDAIGRQNAMLALQQGATQPFVEFEAQQTQQAEEAARRRRALFAGPVAKLYG